ncbi:MAG: hypothetical protein A2X08_17865 [Bacteroidetes bacterium GWA2_32_17]|nr:MAG: hypothetical protein A2X08_17865 [Bacteroidetes bacterium GWA2_32_17]
MKNILPIIAVLFPLIGLTQPKYCDVSFSYELSTTSQNIKFISNTVDTNRVVSWYWDFGDSTFSNLQNPKHQYLQNGTYIVCLTIYTYDSCENTFCDTIKVGTISSYYSISGNVNAGNALLPSGVVLLIDKDNNYKANKYSIVIDGHYEFYQVQAGNYIIYAIPNFNIDFNYYPTYLPTYFGDKTKWKDATGFTVTSSLDNQNINLKCNTDILYGPDTITGNIKILDANSFEYNIYYNNWFGNNVSHSNINLEIAPNVPVILLNSDDEPIRFAMTDSTGSFLIKNLPIKVYKVAPEKAGLVTIPAIIDFTATASNIINTNLFIATSNIYSYVSENYYSETINEISIFPNPTPDNAIVNISINKSVPLLINIENIDGKTILSKNFVSQGLDKYILPLSNLSAGVYILKIQAQGYPIVVKKIIKY